MQARVQPVTFDQHGDDRGQLIAIETASRLVPFEVRRCYYIFDTTPGTVRGLHAHKELRQLLFCVNGSCTIKCELPDGRVESHVLDWPNKGLVIEGPVWRVMENFSKGAVLVVLASEHYSEEDYIRDYDEYVRIYGIDRGDPSPRQ